MLVECLASLGQLHTLAPAYQQLHAEFLEAFGHGRQGDVQQLRGRYQAAGADHGEEYAKMTQIDGGEVHRSGLC